MHRLCSQPIYARVPIRAKAIMRLLGLFATTLDSHSPLPSLPPSPSLHTLQVEPRRRVPFVGNNIILGSDALLKGNPAANLDLRCPSFVTTVINLRSRPLLNYLHRLQLSSLRILLVHIAYPPLPIRPKPNTQKPCANTLRTTTFTPPA
ncbi:hypothetical protein WAI453_006961 [Rhynchosporium graminicola]